MKLAIDGFSLTYAPSGFLTYSTNVIESLSNISEDDVDITVYVPERRYIVTPIQNKLAHIYSQKTLPHLKVVEVQFPIWAGILYRLLMLTRSLFPGELDDVFQTVLFMWLRYILPSAVRSKKYNSILYLTQMACHTNISGLTHIAVVHDVISWIPYRGNKKQSYIKLWTYNYFLASLRSFDRIIAVSLSTKADLVSEYGFKDSMITTVYENVNPSYSKFFHTRKNSNMTKQDVDFKKKYAITKPYILANNPFNPRKNSAVLLQSIHAMKTDVDLFFIGDAKRKRELEIKDQIMKHASLVTNKKVRFIEVSGLEELSLLYKNSLAFFVLSYKEGFGLPPLEAMACGTIPVVSRVSSILEVLNHSEALFVNPFSKKEIEDAISTVSTLSQSDRQKLIKQNDHFLEGFVTKYNWNSIGKHIIYVIESTIRREFIVEDFA